MAWTPTLQSYEEYLQTSAAYYTTYRGLIRNQDGSFGGFIRNPQPVHMIGGYWIFRYKKDEQRAHARGIWEPEQILMETELSQSNYEDIEIRWMRGYNDPNAIMALAGTASWHLGAISEIRHLLGWPMSSRDHTPIYPSGTDARLKRYWDEKYALLHPQLLVAPTPITPALPANSSAPEFPQTAISTGFPKSVPTHEPEAANHTATSSPLALEGEASRTLSPTTSTSRSGPDDQSCYHQPTTHRAAWHDQVTPNGIRESVRQISPADVPEQIEYEDDWETDSSGTYIERETDAHTGPDVLAGVHPSLCEGTRTNADASDSTHLLTEFDAPTNVEGPTSVNAPTHQDVPSDTDLPFNATATTDAEAIANDAHTEVEAHVHANVSDTGIVSTNTSIVTTAAASEDSTPPPDTKVPMNAQVCIHAMAPTDANISSHAHVPTSAKPVTGAKINTDNISEELRTYMEDLKNLPCMDCGKLDSHTVDCHLGNNPTILDYRVLADAVERFDPGPWKAHFDPFPAREPEDTATQIRGMADIIRNEDSYRDNVELHHLPDHLMIILWAFTVSGQVIEE
ncbi:hypothetical protein PtrSN002B_002407 [Pyrenophora tritici-repentis]|nr:uncharacterized protein PTRG_00612 [Pyrenophora tritici-repentis Pt-1C-BFP]KAA8625215.1 hypothetical protein PtrV1_00895 [Pyrenophora tritici-repentis]EDU40050.1 conserved hypothetical protein [Pyrenophora tritici-repentis Pt-1C-BFP]KAI0584657.1 hypothetical protein Alg130_05127 [Pyrenophora tritici-repentis]KAI0611873.1 hypothetical protein TUN205_03866 [Pyrenophora tritici-repentis]KAI0623384.1 hypothetical protein TUN199_04627 [Pyrenophora tritici-repentis]